MEDRRRPPVRTGEIDTLLTERKIGPLTGFRNKMGRTSTPPSS
jgi:hypothetical protein